MLNFKSGFERTLSTQLKRRGVCWEYETLKLPYKINHVYNPDFIVTTESGRQIIIEAKGRFRPGDVAKMRAVKAQHPHLDIRFVFMAAHNNIPGQKGTYAKWAERHGFPWADGSIPEEWFDE